MGTCEELMELAQEQVGITSGERYWEWYRKNYASWLPGYVNGFSTPYCAIFDSCMLAWTKTRCPWFPNTYAFDWTEDLEGRGVDKYDLQRGDMVAFDWGIDGLGDHVGIVKSVHDWGICTIEGNTSGGVVAECQRLWSVVICGVRPWYDEEEEVTEDDKRDIAKYVWEYVHGEQDIAEDVNGYNATHWAYRIALRVAGVVDEILSVVKRIAEKLGA